MKNLLESGVHFGHQTKRWDPRMARYIFAERNGIHIIDLQKTIVAIKEAYETVRQSVLAGKHVLFVGTKKQAQDVNFEREATRAASCSWVNQRWLGGTAHQLQDHPCRALTTSSSAGRPPLQDGESTALSRT